MTKQPTAEELTPLEPIDFVDLFDDDVPPDDRPRARRRILRVALLALAAALVLVVLAAVVGPYVYIHFIEADPPKPLTFAATDSKTTGTPSTPAGVAGGWNVTGGSTVGYRVSETLFGQGNTAVGRTPVVTGDMSITDTSVRSATFTVDVTGISSDSSGRDRSY
jgi:polyisoprenoid-binding protein YceI